MYWRKVSSSFYTFLLFIKENSQLYKKTKCDTSCILSLQFFKYVMEFDPAPVIRPSAVKTAKFVWPIGGGIIGVPNTVKPECV